MGFGGGGTGGGGGFGGGGGSGLPPVTGNDGYAIIEVGGVAAFRPILGSYVGPGFGINSFLVSSVEPIVEIGVTVTNPAFIAGYTSTPDSASVIDDQGGSSEDVSSTPTTFSYTGAYTKTANGAVVNFTLTATKSASSAHRSANITWQPKVYWGVGPDGLATESDIKGLANSPLNSSRAITFTAAPGPSQFIYYAYPASYGAGTFYVDGWEGGFDLVSSTINVTNHGVTQAYRLYKSTNPNLGSTNVQVV